jgi:hypothetical protein
MRNSEEGRASIGTYEVMPPPSLPAPPPLDVAGLMKVMTSTLLAHIDEKLSSPWKGISRNLARKTGLAALKTLAEGGSPTPATMT